MKFGFNMQPSKRWVDFDFQMIKETGQKGYWQSYPQYYGINFRKHHLTVYFGEDQKDFLYPWKNKELVRESIFTYNRRYMVRELYGVHYYTNEDKNSLTWNLVNGTIEDMEDEVPKLYFTFSTSTDKKKMYASSYIAEYEWRMGKGLFKLFRLFQQPIINRYLIVTYWNDNNEKTVLSVPMDVGQTPLEALFEYGKENGITEIQYL